MLCQNFNKYLKSKEALWTNAQFNSTWEIRVFSSCPGHSLRTSYSKLPYWGWVNIYHSEFRTFNLSTVIITLWSYCWRRPWFGCGYWICTFVRSTSWTSQWWWFVHTRISLRMIFSRFVRLVASICCSRTTCPGRARVRSSRIRSLAWVIIGFWLTRTRFIWDIRLVPVSLPVVWVWRGQIFPQILDLLILKLLNYQCNNKRTYIRA